MADGASVLDHAQVRGLLRQRYPLLLLDRVIAVDPPSTIAALKAVTASEPCYAHVRDGAGPEAFEYPLALLVESFGQAVSVLWTLTRSANRPAAADADDAVPLLGSVRDLVVEAPVLPGDVIEHHVRLDHASGDTRTYTGVTKSAGRTVLRIGALMVISRPATGLLPTSTDTATAATDRATHASTDTANNRSTDTANNRKVPK